MTTVRRGVLIVALAAAGLGLAAPARADVIISSPGNTSQVGITIGGNLFTGSTGFRRVADGYDPILGNNDGFPREYWGVSAGPFHGYVDPTGRGGAGGPGLPSLNIAPNPASPLTAGPGGHSATLGLFLTNGAATNVLQIDQTYTFPRENVLDIHITVTNLTANPLTNLQYRRGIDFDIAPFNGGIVNQTVNVPPFAPPVLAATTTDLDAADPFNPYVGATPGGSTVTGDRAGGLTIGLGTLDPFGTPNGRVSTSFDIFEGINTLGEPPLNLVGDMNAAGANYVILGFTGSNSAAIGVLVQNTVPEPATVALFGLGLAGLAGWRLRRKASV